MTDPAPDEWTEVRRNRPAKPTYDQPVEVSVVGKRCVYVNHYRIAGGKPYVSENLPTHNLKTTLGDVLSAFSTGEILAALHEKEQERKYFERYHASKKNQEGEQA